MRFREFAAAMVAAVIVAGTRLSCWLCSGCRSCRSYDAGPVFLGLLSTCVSALCVMKV